MHLNSSLICCLCVVAIMVCFINPIFAKDQRFLQVDGEKINSKITPIDFGVFADVFHVDADKLYIGRWDCADMISGEVGLSILDRNSLSLIKNVQITNCDEVQQNEITSITTDSKRIYLSIAYRYPDDKTQNFIVLDKESGVILERKNYPLLTGKLLSGSLLTNEERIYICSFLRDDCYEINIKSKELIETSEAVCGQQEPWVFSKGNFCKPDFFKVETRNYFISAPYPRDRIKITQKVGQARREVLIPKAKYNLKIYPIKKRDEIILTQKMNPRNSKIFKINLSNGVIEQSYDLTTGGNVASSLQVANEGNYIFVGAGHDLYIYKLSSFELIALIENVITEGESLTSSGLDRNDILKIVLDNDRLIIMTFDGKRSRVIFLEDLMRAIGVKSWFQE